MEIDSQLRDFDWVSSNKSHYIINQTEEYGFTKRIMKTCVKPCLTNLETTVISNEEAECFTNCMGKGATVGKIIQQLNADAEMKRYGGYRA